MKKKIVYTALPLMLIALGSVFSAFTTTKPASEVPAVGLNIGDQAPELSMTGLDGKTYKLSELRGKIVLIDFWASWCGPCRRENPNVVSAYQKYSKAKFKTAKGFDIFSVSLDNNEQAWKAAVQQDKLTWKYHVCDFGGWNSQAAATYGVHSIPMSFLINEKGIIVGKGLRGLELHSKIDEYVKSF